MKISVLSLLILTFFAFSSCDKSPFDKDDKKDFDKDYSKDHDKDDDTCFDMVYPVTYTMPDGSTLTFNDEASFWDGIKAYYEANDTDQKPQLQYPVDIDWEDGTTQSVDNEEEMTLAKENCDSDEVILCDWDGSLVTNNDSWAEQVVEPITITDACGCPVDGVIKYVNAQGNIAHVIYYGKDSCTNTAWLVTYTDYNTDFATIEKCRFEMDCVP